MFHFDFPGGKVVWPSEQWVYAMVPAAGILGSVYVYFENALVSSWQQSQQ